MSVKTFGCKNCGQPYQAYPPDSKYQAAYIKPCQDGEGNPNHNYKQLYECENCAFENVLYWCPGHVYIGTFGGADHIKPHRTKYAREHGFG